MKSKKAKILKWKLSNEDLLFKMKSESNYITDIGTNMQTKIKENTGSEILGIITNDTITFIKYYNSSTRPAISHRYIIKCVFFNNIL